ncbi:hypothetical protein AAY473_033217 [Plecturocebus cupreus]
MRPAQLRPSGRQGAGALPGADPPPAAPFPPPPCPFPHPHPRSAPHSRPCLPGHLGASARQRRLHLSRQGRVGSPSRAPLLDRVAPALPGFLFNKYHPVGTGGERPAELPPGLGLGWARCPGFLSPLGQAAPEKRRRHPLPCTSRDPGPHLAVSREEEATGLRWSLPTCITARQQLAVVVVVAWGHAGGRSNPKALHLQPATRNPSRSLSELCSCPPAIGPSSRKARFPLPFCRLIFQPLIGHNTTGVVAALRVDGAECTAECRRCCPGTEQEGRDRQGRPCAHRDRLGEAQHHIPSPSAKAQALGKALKGILRALPDYIIFGEFQEESMPWDKEGRNIWPCLLLPHPHFAPSCAKVLPGLSMDGDFAHGLRVLFFCLELS